MYLFGATTQHRNKQAFVNNHTRNQIHRETPSGWTLLILFGFPFGGHYISEDPSARCFSMYLTLAKQMNKSCFFLTAVPLNLKKEKEKRGKGNNIEKRKSNPLGDSAYIYVFRVGPENVPPLNFSYIYIQYVCKYTYIICANTYWVIVYRP